MIALAVAALLATTSPADTTLRVPGTTLRFGADIASPAVRRYAVASPGVRRGTGRFFGLDGQCTLHFEDGALGRAEFSADSITPAELRYVEDELTRMGYRRRCTERSPRATICEWSGRAHLRIDAHGGSLRAEVTPPGARAGGADSSRVPPRGPDHGAASEAAGAGAALARLGAAPGGGPAPAVKPPPGTAPTPPSSTVTAATPAPLPAPAAAGTGPVRADSGAVPILPETLSVVLPPATSRFARVGVVSRQECPYPREARTNGVQGRVWLHALIGPDGSVSEVHVARGIRELNEAALACVRSWRLQPLTTREGAPSRYWAEIPVTFRLH